MNTLERRYRRLLLAFPPAYRRQRGEEMLTTLMDGAPPDRTRPPASEAWELLRVGLRLRLGPPRGRVFGAVTVVAAITIGYAGLSAVARQTADMGRETMVTAMSLLPESMVTGNADRMLTAFGGPTEVEAIYPAGPEALDGLATGLRDRAVADGWAAGPIGPGHRFTLDRAGESLVVSVLPGDPGPGSGAAFQVRYPWPAWALPVGAAVVLLGGLTGWLVAAWVLRRFRSRVPAARLGLALLGLPSLLFVIAGGVSTAAALWSGAIQVGFAGPLTERLGLLGLAATLVLALVLPAERATATPPQPTDPVRWGARLVLAAHLAFGLAIATVLVTFTARMLTSGVDRATMLSGAQDPKDLLPLPVFLPVALLYYAGVILSPLLLTVSVPLLATGRQRVGPLAWNVLLVAAVSAVALPALLLTPYGGDAARWWLD
ncbi:hypothetical protein AB0J74_05640 [Asanoa sp. NPDC049573]|uniref:hypothetical protein n=1 Tax=Asanoa sp. NPDC049573 TaxID=3155396 RepID=UPI00343D686F